MKKLFLLIMFNFVIFATNNDISKIIEESENTSSLNLSNKELNSIPEKISTLVNLKHLDLSNNQIKNLPKSIQNICKYLDPFKRVLLLDGCSLNVSNNRLSYLPKEIANIKYFILLKFDNNYFDNLPISFKKIKFATVYSGSNLEGIDRKYNRDFIGFYEVAPNLEEQGYSFFSLLIDYSFEGNKTISFKPILGDNFNIISYLWNFGDGNYSNEENPIYTYLNYGDYNVTLTLNSGEYNASKLISLYPRVFEFKKGWNMITPSTKDDINASIFDIVWSYENENWNNNHSFLKPTIGYWVKLNQDLNYSYSGEVYKLPNYKIKQNWNFLGSGEKYFKEANQTIYQFKNGNWIINPKEIKRGEGFWIKK